MHPICGAIQKTRRKKKIQEVRMLIIGLCFVCLLMIKVTIVCHYKCNVFVCVCLHSKKKIQINIWEEKKDEEAISQLLSLSLFFLCMVPILLLLIIIIIIIIIQCGWWQFSKCLISKNGDDDDDKPDDRWCWWCCYFKF